jgi:fructose transport system permease protein
MSASTARPVDEQDRTERRLGDPLGNAGASRMQRLQRALHANPLLGPAAVLVAAFVAFTGVVGPRFIEADNLSLIVQQVHVIGMVGIAQTLIILTAGIDLSVGAVAILTTIVAGKAATEMGLPGPLALAVALLTGALCGLLNGVLVAGLRVPPFIATLGTFSIFTAVTIAYSESETIRNDIPALLTWPGQSFSVLGSRFTYGSVIMLAGVVVAAWVLRRTAWGEHVYMTGDNADGARLSGIRTGRVLISVYVVAGVVCAIAGWLIIGRVGSISPFSGENLHLLSITAVVIGGTSLFGGRGHVVGTLIGALIVGVFDNGLTLAGVDDVWQIFTTGVLVILAVAVDQWTRRVAG